MRILLGLLFIFSFCGEVKAALVLGTNCGFVATAPTSDPSAGLTTCDRFAYALSDTSPATAAKITEVGWYASPGTEEANFEVGLYAADGAGGIPGTLLYSDTVNAKGTTEGQKLKAVDWAISSSTAYWIAFQLDNTATQTSLDGAASGGPGNVYTSIIDALPSPYGTPTFNAADGIVAIYAVWEAAPSTQVIFIGF